MDAASGVLRRRASVDPADWSAVALGQSRDDFISETIRQTGEIVFAEIERVDDTMTSPLRTLHRELPAAAVDRSL
jgi:hypothetical protein